MGDGNSFLVGGASTAGHSKRKRGHKYKHNSPNNPSKGKQFNAVIKGSNQFAIFGSPTSSVETFANFDLRRSFCNERIFKELSEQDYRNKVELERQIRHDG